MTPAMPEITTSFRAIGSDCRVIIQDHDQQAANDSLDQVKRLFRRTERRFSRFLPDSELSQLNRAGYLAKPSNEMVDVLRRAMEWSEITHGLFNPAILPQLEVSGYAHSFEQIGNSSAVPTSAPRRLGGKFSLSRCTMAGGIALAGGQRIDLGGIVKGWTVDNAAAFLENHPAYLIDAGGDIRVGASSLNARAWHISIENPFNPGFDREIVTLRKGAIATSGTYRRWWGRGDRPSNHLINPRTGLSSNSGVVAVTVRASSTEAAELIAKTCVISGLPEATHILETRPETEGVITTASDEHIQTSGWKSSPLLGSFNLMQMSAKP